GASCKKIPQFQSIDIHLLRKKRVAALPSKIVARRFAASGPMGNDHQAYSLSVLSDNREDRSPVPFSFS
ncbi:hypothetical protein B1M71_11235, partial [Salmonella enterica subsp. enterica serovar Dublin]